MPIIIHDPDVINKPTEQPKEKPAKKPTEGDK